MDDRSKPLDVLLRKVRGEVVFVAERSAARKDARAVRCPRCNARPGMQCLGGRDQPRISCHKERWDIDQGA